jgi:hypothetical protein
MRDTDIQSTNDHFNIKRSELTFDNEEKKRDTVTSHTLHSQLPKADQLSRSICIRLPHPDTAIRARVCFSDEQVICTTARREARLTAVYALPNHVRLLGSSTFLVDLLYLLDL